MELGQAGTRTVLSLHFEYARCVATGRPVAKDHASGNLPVEFPELFAREKEQERREADRVDQSS
jgi:hypothetical protein